MSDILRSDDTDGEASAQQLTGLVEAKKRARECYRRARRERTPDDRRRISQQLINHAIDVPALMTAQVVASFEPLATEPDIAVLNDMLLARGIDVLIPVTLTDKDLTWRSLKGTEALGKDAIARADVILTPALALGPSGERLGQGGGSYDRALPRCRSNALIIGVVFADELDQIFPCEEHDRCVDMSLTEDGLRSYKTPLPDASLRE